MTTNAIANSFMRQVYEAAPNTSVPMEGGLEAFFTAMIEQIEKDKNRFNQEISKIMAKKTSLESELALLETQLRDLDAKDKKNKKLIEGLNDSIKKKSQEFQEVTKKLEEKTLQISNLQKSNIETLNKIKGMQQKLVDQRRKDDSDSRIEKQIQADLKTSNERLRNMQGLLRSNIDNLSNLKSKIDRNRNTRIQKISEEFEDIILKGAEGLRGGYGNDIFFTTLGLAWLWVPVVGAAVNPFFLKDIKNLSEQRTFITAYDNFTRICSENPTISPEDARERAVAEANTNMKNYSWYSINAFNYDDNLKLMNNNTRVFEIRSKRNARSS